MDANDLPIHAFADLAAWERWLRKNGDKAAGAWLKLSKAGAAAPTLAKREAIEGAPCHGWIDGQLAAFDAHYFLVRFTPRRRGSAWSHINRQTAAATRRRPRRGERPARDRNRKSQRLWESAYAAQANATLPPDLQAALEASPPAKKCFDALDGANRYAILYRVAQPKKAETRARRIEQFVQMLLRGEAVHAVGKRKRD